MFYQENKTVQERAHVKRISHVVSLGGAVAQARGTGRRRQSKQHSAAQAGVAFSSAPLTLSRRARAFTSAQVSPG